MVRHQSKLVLVGSIPTPKFFSNMIKNFEGGSFHLLQGEELPSDSEGN